MGDALLTLGSVLVGGVLAIVGGIAGGWLQADMQTRADKRVRIHNLLEPISIATARIHREVRLHEAFEEDFGREDANRLMLPRVEKTSEAIQDARSVLTRLDLEAPEYRWGLNASFVMLASAYDEFVDGMSKDDHCTHDESGLAADVRKELLQRYSRFYEKYQMVLKDLDQPEWERFRNWVSQSLSRKRS